jgi:hypothetical protein
MNSLLQMIVVGLAVSTSVLGCTANVEDPVLNQTGRTGDTTCVTSCDDTKTTCVAKCTDDACKASCETTHGSCSSNCTPKDGG